MILEASPILEGNSFFVVLLLILVKPLEMLKQSETITPVDLYANITGVLSKIYRAGLVKYSLAVRLKESWGRVLLIVSCYFCASCDNP